MENSNLKNRVTEQLELCRELEFKYERQLDELKFRIEKD